MSTTKTIESDSTKTYSGLPGPEYWHVLQRNEDGLAWERMTGERITVVESIATKSDGKRWLHVSVAKPGAKKMPTYEDIQMLRKLFIGEHRECYQIFPPKERYVNIHNALHLFCCLDDPDGVLPHQEGVINGNLTI